MFIILSNHLVTLNWLWRRSSTSSAGVVAQQSGSRPESSFSDRTICFTAHSSLGRDRSGCSKFINGKKDNVKLNDVLIGGLRRK